MILSKRRLGLSSLALSQNVPKKTFANYKYDSFYLINVSNKTIGTLSFT